MTNRERVRAAIAHEETDVVPYHILITPEEMEILAEYYRDVNFYEKMNNHFTFLDVRLPPEEIAPGRFQDDFGVVWDKRNDRETGNIENMLLADGDWDAFLFPNPHDPRRFSGYEKVIAAHPGQFIVLKMAYSLFERAWALRGMENLLCDMILEPVAASRFLDRITEYNLALLEHALCNERIDCVHFQDDWGQQNGLIMGPQLWQSMLKPRLKLLFDFVKSKGKYVSIHSCGDIVGILPDLIDMGVDIYNPFQPEICDTLVLKREYGRHLTFWGGISLQQLLPFGTVEEVRADVVQKLDVYAKGGGYILSPSHSVTRDVPPENFDAMWKVIDDQQRYVPRLQSIGR